MVPTPFHLAEVAPPLDPRALWGPVWDGIRAASMAYTLSLYGYDDLADDDVAPILNRYAQQDQRASFWVVALSGERPEGSPDGRVPGLRVVPSEPSNAVASADEVLAVSWVAAPLLDNTHLVESGCIQVRPEAEGMGIEAASLAAHEQIARAYGRDTVVGWVSHRGAEATESETSVADPTGEIRLRNDNPTVRLYVDAGFSLAQAELHSVQPIPVPSEVLDVATDPARAEQAGYELLQWTGPSPDEHLNDVAVLMAAMATDPPLGDVDWRPEVWDAERVRRAEERGSVGGSIVTSVVRHRATHRLVGVTQVGTSDSKPTVALQWSTIVLGEHRGHGLGLLLKAANARLLHDAFPAVDRVHTWNANENDHMLKVNGVLGYAREAVEGCWQKVLTSV